MHRSFGLDCLRALAISCVLLGHFGFVFAQWFGRQLPYRVATGGFYGVELFFVLSGFLIGRILLDLLDQGATWRGWALFLVRRWMRTLPLYYLTLALLMLVWPPHFWIPGHAELWRELPWFVTLTQNLASRKVGDYFTVSWSLAVEEWFYLLFPTLLFAACRFVGARSAFYGVTGFFLILSPAWRWWTTTPEIWGEVTSKLVVCRLDSIAIGVAAAWAVRACNPRAGVRLAMFLLGVAIVIAQWSGLADPAYPTGRSSMVFMFDVVSIGYALLLPAAAALMWAGPGTSIARAIAWTSRISYPLYLVHLSVLEMTSYYRGVLHVSAWAGVAVSLFVTVGLSWLMHRLMEQPVMALRPRQSLLFCKKEAKNLSPAVADSKG